MREKTFRGDEERRILISLIMSKQVLAKVSNVWDRGLFKNKWANLIGDWCIKYHARYKKAPRKNIQNLFNQWADSGRADKSQRQLIEKFLISLSEEYESNSKINADYMIDVAAQHFNRVRVEILHNKMTDALESGEKPEEIEKLFNKYSNINLGATSWVNPLDKEIVEGAFDKLTIPLIKFDGALGKFMGSEFSRDSFVVAMAPEKRGKSFVLMELAWKANLQKNNVAYFVVGDMSLEQVIRRLMIRILKRPDRPKVVYRPISLNVQDNDASVSYKKTRYKTMMSKEERSLALDKIKNKSRIRLSVHPSDSLNVIEIRNIIDSWERVDNWTPDVIVLDYMDIMAPRNSQETEREKINSTWKSIRGLSQERHCCIISATQSDAASYDTHVMSLKNFSDDKRKFGHVTAMFGLNQSPNEKRKDIMRLNWLVRREDESSIDECVFVAGCRSIAHPFMLSSF